MNSVLRIINPVLRIINPVLRTMNTVLSIINPVSRITDSVLRTINPVLRTLLLLPPEAPNPAVKLALEEIVTDAYPCEVTKKYLRLIDSCITQRKAQATSETCKESKAEEEEGYQNVYYRTRLLNQVPRDLSLSGVLVTLPSELGRHDQTSA